MMIAMTIATMGRLTKNSAIGNYVSGAGAAFAAGFNGFGSTVMPSLPVYDRSGNEVGKYDIELAELAPRINKQLLHDVVVMYQANRRLGSSKTKAIWI